MDGYLFQASFASGEIGDKAQGRIDLDFYYTALRTCRNFIVRQYGGTDNRSGTIFQGEVRYPTRYTRVRRFQFSTVQTYTLEFGHLYMRVYKDGAQVLEASKAITGITKANPAVVTSAGHGFSNGDDVYISGVSGMSELNGRSFRVANVTANTFELTDYYSTNINSTAYTAYAAGGTVARIYTLVTPWQETDLQELVITQSADVLTVVHPNYYPRDISRTGHAAWTLSLFNAQEGPFKDINADTSKTVYGSAATGAITLTGSGNPFTSDMVGTLFYIEQKPDDTTKTWEVAKVYAAGEIVRAGYNYYQTTAGGTSGTVRPDHTEGSATDGSPGVTWNYLHSGFGIVQITSYTNANSVNATVIKRLSHNNLAVGGATYNWAKAAWNSTDGYPQAVGYFQQRMIFGGTVGQPQTMWMSGAANARTFFGKSKPILDDEAVTVQLDTREVNAIRHIIPLNQLIVLTSASEQLVSGDNGAILATGTLLTKVQGYNGASKVEPVIINNTALFVQDKGSTVQSLSYSYDSDTYTGQDLTARAPHLFEKKTIREWAYQKVPNSVIWTVMSDGSLIGLTYMKDQLVAAWHRHDTDGLFESVCSISGTLEDDVYFVVKRTINGQTRRYVERLHTRMFNETREAYFVDCGLSYDGRYTAGSTSMTLTGGTTWGYPETLTLTSSAPLFGPSDVGDAIQFWVGNTLYRLTILSYGNQTTVTVQPNKNIPVEYRGVGFTTWEFARNTFTGLDHLEGKTVAILADGNVQPPATVTNGSITLENPHAVVHIGLPFVSDFETLDFASAQGRGDLRGKTINVNRCDVYVYQTLGIKVGSDTSNLREMRIDPDEILQDAAMPLVTGIEEVTFDGTWGKRKRIFIRQEDPLPASILSVHPEIHV